MISWLRHNQRDAWLSLALITLTAGVYWPTVGFEFVNWDDPWYITHNELLESWSPANLKEIATSVVVRNYAPLTIFSFLVDRTLWGDWAGGFHLTNLLLHITNTVLVYFLVFQLCRQLAGSCVKSESALSNPSTVNGIAGLFSHGRFVAWLAAALFAVHPVQIETVAWVSSRKGLLSAACMLASLLYWMKADRSNKDELCGIAWYACALFSKAIAVVLPAIVLLYDVLILRRTFKEALSRQVIPGFMAVWLLMMTMAAQTTELGGVRDHLQLSKLQILAVDAVIVWRYLGMLIGPTDLCVLYDPPTSGIAGLMALASLAWLAVAVAAYRLRERSRWTVLGVAIFFVLLAPVLNLFPITTLMNDRYLYLPVIPVFALCAVGLQRLVVMACDFTGEKCLRAKVKFDSTIGNNASLSADSAIEKRPAIRRWHGALMGLVATAVVMCCIGITSAHLPVWRDDRSLWQHAVANVPQLPVVRIQFANSLHADGRDDEALAVLAETLTKYDPDPADRDRILEKLATWE